MSLRLKEHWCLWEGVGIRWAHDKEEEEEGEGSIVAKDMHKVERGESMEGKGKIMEGEGKRKTTGWQGKGGKET